MSVRPRPSLARATSARLAVACAAGLASVLTVAPLAVAEEGATESTGTIGEESGAEQTTGTSEEVVVETGEESSEGTGGEETGGEETTDGTTEGSEDDTVVEETDEDAEEDSDDTVVEVQALAPDFGLQKYRVGVRLADGSYVPEGRTTVGTTFTITETDQDGNSESFECTTDASTLEPETGASYCLRPNDLLAVGPRILAAAEPDVEVTPDDDAPEEQTFTAAPGDTITIEIEDLPEGLVGPDETATVEPCEGEFPFPEFPFALCTTGGGQEFPFFELETSQVLFAVVGLPPIAEDDEATTREGRAVDIDVLDNDDTVDGAPLEDLDVTSDPDDGSARVEDGEIVYTPDDGFTGTDRFEYTIETPNGFASAEVTVRVRGGADNGDRSISDDTVTPTSASLPDAGGADMRLLGLGAALLAGGAALASRGRRTRVHAGTD